LSDSLIIARSLISSNRRSRTKYSLTAMDATMTDAVAQLVRSKWTQITIVGLLALHLLKKMKARSAVNQIQSVFRSRIEVAVRDREASIEWARKAAALIGDEERRQIESMDFRQLKDALQSRAVTAESVVRAYYGLAVQAHEKTNCLTYIIKESLAEARKLDEKALDHSYKMPRLFGMPLSVKDVVEVEGHRSTWGLAKFVDNIAAEDSYQVMKLRAEGMIPFCQTNVPTNCLTINCSNSIYGTTSNPHSELRTCGGSSGGEAALIAAGGSICGLGSDMGGSIRVPAAFSGCCGFKPSATRFSTLQAPEPFPMRPVLMTTEGPMAREPHAIVEMMRSAWSDHFLSDKDAFSVPIDFREDLFQEGRKYRIGYYTTDGYIDALPGNQRVVSEAVELLRAKGHDLFPFSLGDIAQETSRGVYATLYADGGAGLAQRLKDEPLSDLMAPLRYFVSVPMWAKTALGWMYKYLGDPNTSDFFLCQSTKAIDVQAGVDRVFASRKRLLKKMKDEQVDLILCPATYSPAMPHELPLSVPFPVLFATMLWNAMDFPAGVVPTDKWREEDEAAMDAYEEKGLVEKEIKKGCRNSLGLPLSVQIVAPAFRDEMVMRVMVDLYDSMKKD
ncbi:hypothetical protein PRIPAC_81860, partial [Pristionchus pacificus]